MGQSLSFLTTLSLFSATIHAHCINDEDYVMPPGPEGEKHDCSSLTPQDCRETPGCKWNGPDPDTIHLKSLTMPTVEDGRLKKPLAPIDAITEYIGDYVCYEQLKKQMPGMYEAVLEKFTENPDDVLKITAPPAKSGIPQLASVGKPYIEKKYRRDPIPLLTYSRPTLDTETLRGHDELKITKEMFTLDNLVSIAYIAWWDALWMNNDRFAFGGSLSSTSHPDNMMLYKEGESPRRVFVPIDQGFARTIIDGWFDWEERAKKKIRFTPSGWDVAKMWVFQTKAKEPSASEAWRRWYKGWLRPERYEGENRRAEELLRFNSAYFPQAIKGFKALDLRNKISHIINTIWTVKGVDLCQDMGAIIKKEFAEDPTHGLLKDTNMKKATERAFDLVKTVIGKQIDACTGLPERLGDEYDTLKSNAAPMWKAIEEARGKHALLSEFLEGKAFIDAFKPHSSSTAKHMQYDDVLDMNIESKDVGQDSDDLYDDEADGIYAHHSLHVDDPNHFHSLISGKYNDDVSGSGSYYLIGGVVGASSVIIIMLIFCLGLTFGMIIYWGYSQKRALDVKRNKGEMRNWIDDNED
eukprot:678823_1